MIIQKKESFQEQIDRFYQNKLPSSREIRIGKTPEILQKIGARDLPLIMKQSNLRKSIREPKGSRSAHQIGREVIENIPEIVSKPVLVVEEKARNSLALICDSKNQFGHNILIAVQMDQVLYGQKVNEIKSLYGKEHLEKYLGKFPGSEIHILDKEKAKQLSPSIGLQLSKAPIILDYNNNLSQTPETVKENLRKGNDIFRNEREIAENIKESGFHATKSLICNIQKLDQLTGKNNTMKDICNTYKQGCIGRSQEEKAVIQEIAAECRQMEILQKNPMESMEPEP